MRSGAHAPRMNATAVTMHGCRRNWGVVLPQARGKFVAIANQEAFIAETPAEAWAWVEATHPEDNGAIVHYVRTQRGSRLYADGRAMGS